MAALADPHWETVTSEIRDLMQFIGRQPFATRFYLAGGTALALQIGHRRSIDLDFFSQHDPVQRATRQEVIHALTRFGPTVVEDVDGNLLLEIPNLHIAFLSYGYPLARPTVEVENVALASITDVGLMKLDALISRGSRKDFYDVYFVAQQTSIDELLALGRAKYPYARDFEVMAVESLVLFDNAEGDLQPELLVELPWSEVKRFFRAEGRRLGRGWLGR